MNLEDFAQKVWALLHDQAVFPIKQFFLDLNSRERAVHFGLLAAAAVLGFLLGRRRSNRARGSRSYGAWRFPTLQNSGEVRVSRMLLSHFRPPDYHLMNHVTLQMSDGTTQVDHILVSRFGVFVIETKDYNGWVFGNATDATWTHVHFRRKFRFQNPIHQNHRHVCAIRDVLEFLPAEAIKSVVVFSGNAEFRTDVPKGVLGLGDLVGFLSAHRVEVMSLNRLQFCVGRLETARLAVTGATDVEHVQSLRKRFGVFDA